MTRCRLEPLGALKACRGSRSCPRLLPRPAAGCLDAQAGRCSLGDRKKATGDLSDHRRAAGLPSSKPQQRLGGCRGLQQMLPGRGRSRGLPLRG